MAACALVAAALVACSKDDAPAPQEDPEFYTVQLGWDGEILDVVGYEPLTRANSADDLYGIQVYSRPDDDATTPTWTPFAYGLFDGAADISINLLKGYKYKFVATMVVDGKNKIASGTGGYYQPFSRQVGISTSGTELENKFDYQSEKYILGLHSGHSSLKPNQASFKNPNTERFYGELVDYEPGEKGAKAKINMKRTSFGAKFIVKGAKAKDGKLKVQLTGAPAMELALTTSDNQISDIFTFSNVAAAWADNKYTETIAVTINWERPDGTTLPLGTHDVTYKRNATTVVHVNIENDGTSNGLGFETAETETGTPTEDGENDITITDGEVVDTEVDTNK